MIRTALVTGAARGIGRAIALRLAKDGFNIAVNDIEASSSELQQLQQEIEELGRKSIAIIADVSDSKSVEKMMQEVAEKLGSLDVCTLYFLQLSIFVLINSTDCSRKCRNLSCKIAVRYDCRRVG